MKWSFIGSVVLAAATAPGFIAEASAGILDPGADYSTTNNPAGPWSYGRKWTPNGTSFDLFTYTWGSGGWYTGNWGNGGPSIQGTPVELWAKNNGNGLPCLRWTCPTADFYSPDLVFTGVDTRGVDVNVFVALNGTVVFDDHLGAVGATARYAPGTLSLNTGDTLDFVVQWNGGVYSEYSWTSVTAASPGVPEPASLAILASGVAALLVRRRRA